MAVGLAAEMFPIVLFLHVAALFTEAEKVTGCDEMFFSTKAGPKNGTFSAPDVNGTEENLRSCTYTFIAASDERVELTFTLFNIRDRPPKCTHERIDLYVEVRNSTRNSPAEGPFCGENVPQTHISLYQTLVVRFYTDFDNITSDAFQGTFRFISASRYKVGVSEPNTSCSFLITSDQKKEGALYSATYPGVYPRNLHCIYTFVGKPGQRVRLLFNDFDLSYGGSNCPFDHLRVFDGATTSDPLIGTYCGQQKDLLVFSSAENFTAQFTTMGKLANSQHRGFAGFYAFLEQLESSETTSHAPVPARNPRSVPKSLFSWIPCRTNPFSWWRNEERQTYALTPTELWIFSAKADNWTQVKLSTPKKLSTAWRVRCVNSWSATVSNGSDVLILRPAKHEWFNPTIPEASTPSVTWCTPEEILIYQLSSGILYTAEQSGNVTKLTTSKFPVRLKEKSRIQSWILNGVLFLAVEKYMNNSKLMNDTLLYKTNASTLAYWKIASRWKLGQSGFPPSLSKSYTWSNGSYLWIWRETPHDSQVWTFNVEQTSWNNLPVKKSNITVTPLLAFSEMHRSCMLSSLPGCVNNHSKLVCVLPGDSSLAISTLEPSTSPAPSTTMTHEKHISATSTAKTFASTTYPPTHVTAVTVPENASTATTPIPRHLPTSSKPSVPTVVSTEQLPVPNPQVPTTNDVTTTQLDVSSSSAAEAPQNNWHQQNSGIFGSIIFFGTSITIFTIVGIVWCIRHCVHFPKEALLLRDPPSVRYTAIPDTIA